VPLLPSDVLRIARTARPEYLGRGGVVTAPVTASEWDLRALAGQAYSLLQWIPAPSNDELKAFEDLDPARLERFWACHWDCQSCSYPERTGDLRSVVKPSDFYSPRH